MAISLTLFNNIFDNKTDKRIDAKDFDAFEETLYELSEKPFETKKAAMLMSPAMPVYMRLLMLLLLLLECCCFACP